MRASPKSLILALAVVGCVDGPPETKNAAKKDVTAAQESVHAPAATLPPQEEAGPTPAENGKGTPMLSGIISSNTVSLPAALNRGSFRRNGNCLEVVVGGEAFTPILFAISRDLGPGFVAGGKVYDYGRRYILEGGPVLASDPGMEVSAEVRESCVAKYYAVGAIRPD